MVFVDDEGANCRLGLRLLAKLGIPAANVTVLHDGRGQGTSVHNHVTHGRTWRWLCQPYRSHKHEHASAHADTPRHILTHTLKLTDANTHRRTRRHSQTHRHAHTGTPRTTTQTHIHMHSLRSCSVSPPLYVTCARVPCRAGEEASAFLTRDTHDADVMLLDIRMPGKTGLEVMRDLGRDPSLPFPIVAMTGHVDVDAQQEFR